MRGHSLRNARLQLSPARPGFEPQWRNRLLRRFANGMVGNGVFGFCRKYVDTCILRDLRLHRIPCGASYPYVGGYLVHVGPGGVWECELYSVFAAKSLHVHDMPGGACACGCGCVMSCSSLCPFKIAASKIYNISCRF